jgi:hypothetical protein
VRLSTLEKKARCDIYSRCCILAKDYGSPGGSHMIKLRNFWLDYGKDTVLVVVLNSVVLGLYWLAAYLIT